MTKVRNLGRDKLDFANGKIGPLFRALFFPTLIGMMRTKKASTRRMNGGCLLQAEY